MLYFTGVLWKKIRGLSKYQRKQMFCKTFLPKNLGNFYFEFLILIAELHTNNDFG